jgi:hypothetical protein
LKIDVPGLTPEIFQGAARTLARPELREIQVEMRESEGGGGRRVLDFLEPYGLRVVHRNRRLDGRISDLVIGRAAEAAPIDG